MKRHTKNDPAFPIPVSDRPDSGGAVPPNYRGLTVEEWFAGQALAGLLANPENAQENEEKLANKAKRLAKLLVD